MGRASNESTLPEDTRERRRRDLLGAAYELIAEKGLEGLRTRDIAARAGVNISTLHYYFGTKEALLEAVVAFVAQKFVGEGARTQPSPPTLRHHLQTAQRTFRKNPELVIVLQELALRSQRDATTRAAFRPIFTFWNLQVESVLSAEASAGTMPANAPAAEWALIVTSFIMGAMTQRGVNAKAIDFEGLAARVEALMRAQR